MKIFVSDLYIYPIKSGRAVRVSKMNFDSLGPCRDREWALVRPDGRVVTQRDAPTMVQIVPSLSNDLLRISWNDEKTLCEVPLVSQSTRVLKLNVFESIVDVHDEGDLAASAISAILGQEVRLVRFGDQSNRLSGFSKKHGGTFQTRLTDTDQVLVTSNSSLKDLETRANTRFEMLQFRPNIVLEGAHGFAEDHWQQLTIGKLVLVFSKPCKRCVITTLDPESGNKLGQEPLKTLATFRAQNKGVTFGVYFQPQELGEISVGDEVSGIILNPNSGSNDAI